MHTCGPAAKVTWRFGARRTSNASGSGNVRGSRFAAAIETTT
jgi:hypothetical protein